MIHRTIAALLLTGLASPVLAASLAGPAYDQAAGMAAGKSADAAYDGSTARTAVRTQVDGAVKTGDLAVEKPSAEAPTTVRTAPTTAAVPEPAHDAAKGPFFTRRATVAGGAGAAAGAVAGFFLGGGLFGAAIGALAGFAIGFALSKMLE